MPISEKKNGGKKYSKLQIKFIFPSKLKIIPASFISFNSFVSVLLGIVFLCCKVFEIVKVGWSTPLAELSFRHAFYVVRDVGPADIRVLWLVHLAWLRSHVLRAYCNLKSKQANSITLIGQFTVMDGSKADGELVMIQTFLLYFVNQVILMVTSIFQGQFP